MGGWWPCVIPHKDSAKNSYFYGLQDLQKPEEPHFFKNGTNEPIQNTEDPTVERTQGPTHPLTHLLQEGKFFYHHPCTSRPPLSDRKLRFRTWRNSSSSHSSRSSRRVRGNRGNLPFIIFIHPMMYLLYDYNTTVYHDCHHFRPTESFRSRKYPMFKRKVL